MTLAVNLAIYIKQPRSLTEKKSTAGFLSDTVSVRSFKLVTIITCVELYPFITAVMNFILYNVTRSSKSQNCQFYFVW